ncbi:hypothetical protein GCM10019016_043970 [Streptomyces prasinosporus]|uniref:Uncharacterized protein n=1 Tax=Streptomyces prasinosporus TaxID=68256 RepID=A0ABP6TS91_9ACTN
MRSGTVRRASCSWGPLSVLLSGALGVLLARLVASALAAPLLIVFLLLSALFVAVPTDDGWTRWLAPVVGEYNGTTLPSGLLGRPAAWHALYLAGLALTAALGAVLLSGGARLWTVRAGAAGAVALTLVGAVAQTRGVPPETAEARTRISVAPEEEQRCAERAGTTYCAFPEWTPRTGDWAEVVESVRALAGGTAQDRPAGRTAAGRGAPRAVRRLGAPRGHPSGRGDRRARPGAATACPEFSVAVAGVLVTGEEEEVGLMCDGRTVTVMWLALAGRPDPVSDLGRVRLDDSVEGSAVVISQTQPLNMTAAHTELVRELLERPRDEVAAKVRAHWAELTAPRTTTDRVRGPAGPGRSPRRRTNAGDRASGRGDSPGREARWGPFDAGPAPSRGSCPWRALVAGGALGAAGGRGCPG